MAKKPTKKHYQAAAKDLNKTLGLEPPINPEDTIAVLEEKLLEAKGMLYPDDEIEKSTEKLLAYIAKKRQKDTAEESAEPEEAVEESAEPEEVEADNHTELRQKIEEADNRKKLLQIATSEEVFKPFEKQIGQYKDEDSLRAGLISFLDDNPDNSEDEEEAAETVVTENAEQEPAEEAEEVKKPEKKASKPAKTKTEFGSLVTAQTGQIDRVIMANKGKKISVQHIADEVGVTRSRVKDHLRSLIKKRGINLNVDKNKDGYFITYE